MSRRFQIVLARAALASPTGTRFHNLLKSASVIRKRLSDGDKAGLQLNAKASKPEQSRKKTGDGREK
ncbi:hypothetical protein [Bradyrhizobium sp. RDI18]|uniref:hypothetical protein n=1 Tax=Bradyrhizobium sp. RDI18 TaxID=3367400 RepID=UPI0037178B92